MSNDQSHYMHTPEGKRASIEGRRRREAGLPAIDAPAVFVVRLAGAKPFGWEIRRFGNITLSRSETGFGTQVLAQEAGANALKTMLDQDPRRSS